ncbi:MAG: amidohydrolase [Candidatus ainarchaeum sp.]|nr:amidohydrolase [Candidatus ainarchaeum sp.]
MMYEIFGGLAVMPEGIRKDISLVVEKDRIIDIGPAEEMRKRYKFSDSIGSKDSIVCPAFVDTHMHSFQIATRGLTSDKSLLDWLKRYIWRWEGSMSKEQAKACAELAYLEMLKSGVTTFVDYTSVRHTDEAFKAAKAFGMRGNIGKTLMDRASPPELQESPDKALRDTESLIRKWHGEENDRLRYNITPRFGITCTDGLLEGCKELMGKYDVLFTTHASESSFEVDEDRKNYGESSIRHFEKLGLLGKKTLLAHCVWLDDSELKLLAKTKTRVAHCPGSNMMLASGAAQTGRMLKEGVAVGLGSDMGAYYNLSMFDQMRLSVMLQKVTKLNPLALDHRNAFNMATKGGADALGIESGTLEKGKKADIVLLDARNIAFSPENDIIAQIVYCAGPGAVQSVVCDGKPLIMDGKVLVANEEKILERAKGLLAFSA